MVQRGDKGQLKKGSVLNPKGRPKKQIEEKYLEIFRKAVGEDDWKAIIDRAVSQAKLGDAVARKFIADYIIGAPVQKSDVNIKGSISVDWDDNTNDND